MNESVLIENTGASCYEKLCNLMGLQQGVTCRGNTFPNFEYALYKLKSYSIENPTSIDKIKQQLQYSPVLASMDSYSDFHDYDSGIYRHQYDPQIFPTGHAVVIVGYNEDEQYWICKNSWGTNWGEDGYFRIHFGECCIDSRESATVSIDNDCFAKVVPNFFTLDYLLSNQNIISGREHIYVTGLTPQILNKDYEPLRGTVSLHLISGASIDLNNHRLTTIGGSPLLGSGNIIVESGASIKNYSAEIHRTSDDKIVGYYPSTLNSITSFSNTAYRFVVLPSSTVTVPAGSTFKFFNSNGSSYGLFYFDIYGTFNAIGSSSSYITFDFGAIAVNSNNGIRFNSGSSGNIQFTNIKNADRAIYCYNSSPTLLNNAIYNSSIGLDLHYYSSPSLAGYYLNGNNIIRNNGRGVNCDYYSNPFLGGSYGGNNSIYGNTGYNISANYGCSIFAQHVWWGSYPISTQDLSKIYQYQSTVDYSYPLSWDPNSGRSLPKSSSTVGSGMEASNSDDDLLNSLYLQMQGKYDEAIVSYGKTLDKEIKSLKGSYALTKLSECYEKTGKKDFIDYINNNIRPQISKDDDISITSLELESYWLQKDGRYDNVIQNIKKIKDNYKDIKETYRYALFNEGFTYYVYLKDMDKAKKSFCELESLYPEDPLVKESKLLLGKSPKDFSSANIAPIDSSRANKQSSKQSEQFVLLGNYPNPFNPTTYITYTIPENQNVKLVVCDILGKQVAILVNEYNAAGSYTVQFDGSSLPSGIYICTIQAGQFVNSKKLLLLK